MTIRLIGTGVSRRGGSRIGKFDECPTRFYHDYCGPKSAKLEDSSDGTDKGNIGHVMMSHGLLHKAAAAGEPVEVNGEIVDPKAAEDFFKPYQAADAWAAQEGTTKHVKNMQAAYESWEFSGVGASAVALHIESETFGVWGELRGQAGLWAIDPAAAEELEFDPEYLPPETLPSIRGRDSIKVFGLDVPNHPERGWPVWMSRRRDAVWRTQSSTVQTIDHKFLYETSEAAVTANYAGDKWLHIMSLLDSQQFGTKYGGLWLLAIQNHPRYKVNFVPLRPSRTALKIAQRMVWDLEHRRAEWEVEDPSGRLWDRGPSSVCNGKYGKCPYFAKCHG